MDSDEIKEFLALMTRLAVAMEEQAKHQQEYNDMNRKEYERQARESEEWKQLQLQWRAHEQARLDVISLRDAEAMEYLKKNASININIDRE